MWSSRCGFARENTQKNVDQKVSHQPLCGTNCSCSAFNSLRVKVQNSRWFNGSSSGLLSLCFSPHFPFLLVSPFPTMCLSVYGVGGATHLQSTWGSHITCCSSPYHLLRISPGLLSTCYQIVPPTSVVSAAQYFVFCE